MPSLTIKAPAYRRMLRATVLRVRRTSPSYLTITFASDAVDAFEHLGFDQIVRLLFRRPDQQQLRLPDARGNGWVAKLLLIPAPARPVVRNYTIRAVRAAARELDIDFALHDGDGAASQWASQVAPGEEVGLFPEGIQYLPAPTAQRRLLVGDETALPAILSILEHTPIDVPAEVFLEVPVTADIRAIAPHPHRRVHWLPRDDVAAVPGRLALDAVTRAALPGSDYYAFIAGESSLATGLRRHLIGDRGFPRSAITFIGYWKHRRASK